MPGDEFEEQRAVLAALSHLRIFPLPASVLIPGGHLPLHIFEPRYRRMVSDALEGDRVLAVALLGQGWEPAYQGRPEVAKVLGAGFIQHAELLPDGRFNIILHGVTRARLLRELDPTKPYRLVEAEPIPDRTESSSEEQLIAASQGLRQLVLDLASVLPDNAASPLADACIRERDPGRLADLVGAAVLVDHRLRQEFLEETRTLRRLEWVSETVAQVFLQVSRGSGGGYMM